MECRWATGFCFLCSFCGKTPNTNHHEPKKGTYLMKTKIDYLNKAEYIRLHPEICFLDRKLPKDETDRKTCLSDIDSLCHSVINAVVNMTEEEFVLCKSDFDEIFESLRDIRKAQREHHTASTAISDDASIETIDIDNLGLVIGGPVE